MRETDIPKIPLIFTIMSVIILCSLGVWQLKRLEQKKIFISALEENIASAPVYISDNKVNLYSKIILNGYFIANKNIFLYGRRSASPEKDGYYIMSAFKADNNEIYLVSRGWMSHTDKKEAGNFFASDIPDTIEAIALPGESRGFMVPENDNKQSIWFTIDLLMAKELLEVTENSCYLMQVNSKTIPASARPLHTAHLSKIRNDHLEYAITWFSLAICAIIIFFVYINKREG